MITKNNNGKKYLLPGSLCRPVALPPVLEPVWDLGGGEPRALGQLPLLAGGGVGVVGVPVPENLEMLNVWRQFSFNWIDHVLVWLSVEWAPVRCVPRQNCIQWECSQAVVSDSWRRGGHNNKACRKSSNINHVIVVIWALRGARHHLAGYYNLSRKVYTQGRWRDRERQTLTIHILSRQRRVIKVPL